MSQCHVHVFANQAKKKKNSQEIWSKLKVVESIQ